MEAQYGPRAQEILEGEEEILKQNGMVTLGWLKAECESRHHAFDDQGFCQEEGLGFSWRPCGFCRTHLGGDRHEATVWEREKNEFSPGLVPGFPVEICTECLLYLANGDLPEEEGS